MPLLTGSASLPTTATPAACVNSATQLATSGDSFVAVPGASGQPGYVYTYDASSGAALGSPIEVGYDPVSMAVDTTYDQLYVLNQGGTNPPEPPSVSVIDYESGFAVSTTISNGFPGNSAPAAIAVSPGGNHVVIADPGSGNLLMIDPQQLGDNIIGKVQVAGKPSNLAFPGGEPYSLYVGDPQNDRVYVLGLAQPSHEPYYQLDSTVSGEGDPTSLASSGTTLYLGDATTDKIDLFTMGWTDNNGSYTGTLTSDGTSYSTPSNQPDHLALSSTGGTLYVSSNTTTFLEIDPLDPNDQNDHEETVPGGNGNSGGAMAVNADGTVLEMAETNEQAVARWAIDENRAQDAFSYTGSSVPSAVASVPAASMRFYAYVAQSAALGAGQTGDVSVIDLLADQDIADVPVGVNPEAVLPSPDGSSVYVADTGTGTNGSLDVIDTAQVNTPANPVTSLSTNPAIPFSGSPAAWPNALALSPSGDQLLVADFNRGVVYDVELNTASPYTMTTIYLDGTGTTSAYDPVAIAMSPSGRDAYVTDHNDKAITVLQTSGQNQPFTFDKTVTPSPSLTSPHGDAVSPDGRTLYVADEGGGTLDAYPIGASGLLSAGQGVPVGADPEDVAVSPIGSPIYVAVAGTDKTAVVTAGSLGVTQASGGPLPTGVAVTPDASQFLVTNNNTCRAAGSMWIYAAGQTTPSAEINFNVDGTNNTNPFAVAVGPAFSSPATVQSIPPAEETGGGVNPAEVATRTALNDVRAGVDTATGAYSLTLPGLEVASPGLPLDLTPSYDSARGEAGASDAGAYIGPGWTLPYAMTLDPPSLANGCAWTVKEENGSLAPFVDVVDPGGGCNQSEPLANFGPPARVQAFLTTGSVCFGLGPPCYEYTRQGDVHYIFSNTEENGSYPLVGIEDAYGNTIQLGYGAGGACTSSELSNVLAQGAGRSGIQQLKLTWSCSGTFELATVTDSLGRVASFSYDSSGRLTSYSLSGGGDRTGPHVFDFSYQGSSDLLAGWWDPDESSTAPSLTEATTVAYAASTTTCGSTTFDPATTVTAPQIQGQGTTGGASYTPTTTLDYSSYDLCAGTGAVVVEDPDQNVTGASPSYSGDTTLDYYVSGSLMAATAGYGPLDVAASGDDVGNVPDASAATTIYVRDPETLAAREVVDPDGNITTTEWNALGDPVSVTDPDGGTATYLYNPDNEITESTDPLGRTTTYSYSEPFLTAVSDAAGNVTQYLQASDGQTCEELSPNASAAGKSLPTSCGTTGSNPGLTTTTFDAHGDVATVTDPAGDVTSNAYDADGELCGTLSPNGFVADGGVPLSSCPAATGGSYLTVYAYRDVFGDVLQKTTPAQAGEQNGNSWLTYYDLDGRKVAAMTPQDTSCNGNTTSDCPYATYDGYDPDGDLTSVTDGYGDSGGPNETSYTYDADGNRLSMVSPDGNVENGNPNAYRTVYSYDDLGRLVATQDPQGSPSCIPQVTPQCSYVSYEAHDPAGRVVTETTAPTTANRYGVTTLSSYDGNGNVTETRVVNEWTGVTFSETTSVYDAANERTSAVAPDGYWSGQSSSNWTTSYAYDADGRLSGETAPAGEGTTSGSGAGMGTTWYFYDGDGNKVAITDGDGDGTTCNAATTSGCADTTYYGYDLADRLTSVQTAAGQSSATTTSYTYDADGNPHVVANPSGVTTTSTYDSADEMTGVSYSDGTPSVAYAYNVDGTRASMSASGAGAYDFSYAYDFAGRLTGVTNGSATVAGYGYDNTGNVTSLTYPSGLVVGYGYAVDDELKTVSFGSDDQLAFSYDGAGELQTTTAEAGSRNPTLTTTDSYDGGGRLSAIATASSAQSSDILDTTYEDPNNGNVTIDYNGDPTGEEVTTSGTAQPTVYYALDYVGRANYDSTTAPGSRPVSASAQTYTYDKANFVTQGSSVAVQQYYGDGEIEQATSVPGGTPVSFSYDPEQDRIGESSATATTSYAFSASGALCWSAPTATIPVEGSTPSCASPPTGAATYTYDGDGLRETETTTSGTQAFAWDTVGGVPRLLEDGQNDYVYGPGGTPLAQVALATGSVDFLVPDREGSLRDVVSGTTGLSLAYTDYDVYGNPTTSGGLGLFTPFGFQGGYTDASGLVYFQQRYYDPGTGQFLSLDPLNGMTNAGYTFVKDDPLDGTDPTGQMYNCGSACDGGSQDCTNAECASSPTSQSGGICNSAFCGGVFGASSKIGPPQTWRFSQRKYWENFDREGDYNGWTIDDLVEALEIDPALSAALPVNLYVLRGRTFILNTRTAIALERAGIPRSDWVINDTTGDLTFLQILKNNLERAGLPTNGSQGISNPKSRGYEPGQEPTSDTPSGSDGSTGAEPSDVNGGGDGGDGGGFDDGGLGLLFGVFPSPCSVPLDGGTLCTFGLPQQIGPA